MCPARRCDRTYVSMAKSSGCIPTEPQRRLEYYYCTVNSPVRQSEGRGRAGGEWGALGPGLCHGDGRGGGRPAQGGRGP